MLSLSLDDSTGKSFRCLLHPVEIFNIIARPGEIVGDLLLCVDLGGCGVIFEILLVKIFYQSAVVIYLCEWDKEGSFRQMITMGGVSLF